MCYYRGVATNTMLNLLTMIKLNINQHTKLKLKIQSFTLFHQHPASTPDHFMGAGLYPINKIIYTLGLYQTSKDHFGKIFS